MWGCKKYLHIFILHIITDEFFKLFIRAISKYKKYVNIFYI